MSEMEKLLFRAANEISEIFDRKFFDWLFFYTNHIVKTKSNFPLFSSKAKLFFDVFDEVVFFFSG